MTTLISLWDAFRYSWPIWAALAFFVALAIVADVASRGCSNGDIDTAGRDGELRKRGAL